VDGVSEFGDLEKKAEAYAEEHPEQAEKGINEVAGIAERDTDHQHDEQIEVFCARSAPRFLPLNQIRNRRSARRWSGSRITFCN
jgi:hypothetical protein